MGVSENRVPLNPMVFMIIIPITNGYFIGNINPTFSDKPIYDSVPGVVYVSTCPGSDPYMGILYFAAKMLMNNG